MQSQKSKRKKGTSLLEIAVTFSVFFLVFSVGVAFLIQVENTFEGQMVQLKQEEKLFLLFYHIASELEKTTFERIQIKERGREIAYKVFLGWKVKDRDDSDLDGDDDLDRDDDDLDRDDDDLDRDDEREILQEKRKIWWDPEKKAVFWKNKKKKKILLEDQIVGFFAKKESSKLRRCIQVICKKEVNGNLILFSRVFFVPFKNEK